MILNMTSVLSVCPFCFTQWTMSHHVVNLNVLLARLPAKDRHMKLVLSRKPGYNSGSSHLLRGYLMSSFYPGVDQ